MASTIPTDRKTVIGELSRGREIADQLRLMLRQTGFDSNSTAASHGLLGKILDSFTRSITILSCAGGGDSDEVSQVPAKPGLKPEDSGDSCKTPAPKDRRGCYKRRKTSETWTKETPTLFEDGHAWRKYGQKVILNAKHPRNYFRCTHKFDQGCLASKQVQKIEDDPPLYKTTYHGQHTCKNLLNSNSSHHQIIIDAATQDHSSIIWSFGSRQEPNYKPNNNSLVIESPAIKQENKEEYQIKSSPSDDQDYFVTSAFDTCSHHMGGFSSAGSDHGGDVISPDVYSCTASSHSLDMDMMVDSVFDDFLEFRSLS
nr:WRKY transcription factor [Rehmannia glutinosa]